MGSRLQSLSTWLTLPVSSPVTNVMTQAPAVIHRTARRASSSAGPRVVPKKIAEQGYQQQRHDQQQRGYDNIHLGNLRDNFSVKL